MLSDTMILDSQSLKSATLAIRTLSAVCFESRELVLRRLPDTLTFTCSPAFRAPSAFEDPDNFPRGLIRWNKEKDIALIHTTLNRHPDLAATEGFNFEGFAENVRNVAINIHPGNALIDITTNDYLWFLVKFPNLRNFYYTVTCREHPWYMSHWCGASACRQYTVRSTDPFGPGIEEHLYCWPGEGSGLHISPVWLSKPQILQMFQIVTGWNVRPMMSFQGAEEMCLYKDLLKETQLARPLSPATMRSPLYEFLVSMEGRPLAETLAKMDAERLFDVHPGEVTHYQLTAFRKPWEAPVWTALRN